MSFVGVFRDPLRPCGGNGGVVRVYVCVCDSQNLLFFSHCVCDNPSHAVTSDGAGGDAALFQEWHVAAFAVREVGVFQAVKRTRKNWKSAHLRGRDQFRYRGWGEHRFAGQCSEDDEVRGVITEKKLPGEGGG